jgi:hypothetical protein
MPDSGMALHIRPHRKRAPGKSVPLNALQGSQPAAGVLEYATFMRSAYVGIDVAIAKGQVPPNRCKYARRRSPHSSAVEKIECDSPTWLRQCYGARSCLATVLCYRSAALVQVCERLELIPVTIAIDAPRSPRMNSERRRAAELALDRASISCYTTPSVADFEAIRDKVKRGKTNSSDASRGTSERFL